MVSFFTKSKKKTVFYASPNYDHQDILLHEIGDGFAIVGSLVGECLSIREKKISYESRNFFARNPLFLPVRFEAWL